MTNRIQVLILEDRQEDAELMVYELTRAGLLPVWERVETETEYVRRLDPPPDLILADYRLPEMSAPAGLQLLRERGLDVPFIVVSGAMGEDVAVNMMRKGAADYLLKDRLARLGPAAKRALAARELREQNRRAEQELRANEIRFQSFMANSPAVAFIKDAEGRLLYLNATAEQLWGTTAAAWRGKRDDECWPPEVAARLHAHDQAVLTSGRSMRAVEQLVLPDGSILQMLSYKFTFPDAAGNPMLGGMAVDITDQKRTEAALASALAAQEVLLKEVHHRVKNNLQIISSLLNMQARQLNDPKVAAALNETQQRVQSMAIVHEVLYGQGDMSQLDLARYIERLANDIMNSCGIPPDRLRLRLNLAPVSVELNQAIPCGLILNESITNSVRHGFPDGQSGEVLVSLREQDGRVQLRVADTGVGLPPGWEMSQSKTLGLRIIDILTQQLGGRLERDAASGSGFTISFPRTAAMAVHA